MAVPLDAVDRVEHLPTDAEVLSADPPAATEKEPKLDPAVTPAALIVPPVVVPPVVPQLPPLLVAWTDAGRSTYAAAAGLSTAWTKRFEIGGNFVDGNTKTSEYFIGGLMERKYDKLSLQSDVSGRYGTASYRTTQNKWLLNGTADYKHDGNWIVFASQRHVYDERADLDYRGTFAIGPGYKFYDEEDKRAIIRVGPGATIEKYDPPKGFDVSPNIFIETETRWPLYERTQFENKNTLTPTIGDISVYRLVSTYGILVALDEKEKWAFKIGLRHEHNSDPQPGKVKNDYTSSFSLVYTRDKKKKKTTD